MDAIFFELATTQDSISILYMNIALSILATIESGIRGLSQLCWVTALCSDRKENTVIELEINCQVHYRLLDSLCSASGY